MAFPIKQLPKPMEAISDNFELSAQGIGFIHVIKYKRQVLPYCFINLTRGQGPQSQPGLIVFQAISPHPHAPTNQVHAPFNVTGSIGGPHPGPSGLH